MRGVLCKLLLMTYGHDKFRTDCHLTPPRTLPFKPGWMWPYLITTLLAFTSLWPGGIVLTPLALWQICRNHMSFKRITLMTLLFWCYEFPCAPSHLHVYSRSGMQRSTRPSVLCGAEADLRNSNLEHPDADIWIPAISFPILYGIK